MTRAAIGLFILCAVLFLAPGQTQGATFYNPCGAVSLESTAADAPSAITTTFGVGLEPSTCTPFASPTDRPPEWIPSTIVDFTPPGWHVSTDADIPDGAKVGEFKSKVVLGLLDNGCNLVLNLNFDLLESTVDRSKPIEPLPHGTPDRLKPLAVKDSNGIPAAAMMWPAYLDDLATRSGMDLSKVIARVVGVNNTSFPGTTIIWNALIFEPGATIANGVQTDPLLGYPAVSILQDPTSNGSSGDPLSDFCAPFWSEYKLSDTVGGIPYRQNPGDGVYNFVNYSVPSPDADNDGIENQLDPCPYDPNVSGWDPRGVLVPDNTPGDNEVDGLPDECDPDPLLRSPCAADNGASNHDEDCDGWANRVDNCPLVSNDDQADADGDAIGDACDLNIASLPGSTIDGQNLGICLVFPVTVGSGGPAPSDPQQMEPCLAFACVGCSSVGDLDCDDDKDAYDVLLTLDLLADVGTVPCESNAHKGCDQELNAPDITDMLRLVIFHEPLPCAPQ